MSHIRADLHMHSTHSDGTMTPLELLQEAKASNLTAIAITDHDAISAYAEVKDKAKELHIEMITGVEISSELNGAAIHVLGYAFQPDSSIMQEKCFMHQERRRVRNRKMLAKLKAQNMPIEEEELLGLESIGRPHIAMAMMRKGYVQSVQEAFAKYIGENRICYVAGERWTVPEAIEIIHAAKGFAVLAHPHVIGKKSLIRKLLQLPFDGLEAYYCFFEKSVNDYWYKMAQERGWLATGGSDFHGAIKPGLTMGASLCPDKDFCFLRDHFNAHL